MEFLYGNEVVSKTCRQKEKAILLLLQICDSSELEAAIGPSSTLHVHNSSLVRLTFGTLEAYWTLSSHILVSHYTQIYKFEHKFDCFCCQP